MEGSEGLFQKFVRRKGLRWVTKATAGATMGPERMGEMDLLLAFFVFLSCVVACMVLEISLSWALLAGLVCFALVGLRRGYSAPELGRMAMKEMKTAGKVLRIMATS